MIHQQLHDLIDAVLWVGGLMMFGSVILASLVRLIRHRNASHRAVVQVSADEVIARGLQDSPPAKGSALANPQDRALDQ